MYISGVLGLEPPSMQRALAKMQPKLRLDDEVRFIASWLQNPMKVGAVSPSGRALARAVAAEVDPSIPGPIVELGPGTGPVTEALIERGVAPERLILVEYDPEFCTLLRRRFPGATVIQGDAYSLGDTLAGIVKEPLAAIASCLPLMTRPLSVRVRLLNAAIRMLRPGAPFVQFTYAMNAPIPSRQRRYRITSSPRIWKNLPPARVWVYRAD
jgi:phosphatidylethanolamine/phosphatidyl-N-methylethanolamine N-methyltransferase